MRYSLSYKGSTAMRLFLIRHGSTAGNLEKRYIGRTDQPLCEEGIAEIRRLRLPECQRIICSPMKRCVQTAEILFPGQLPFIYSGLRECDFGKFEGKNYTELAGNEAYQCWIDSGGTLPFPCGESPDDFRKRCADTFLDAVGDCAGIYSAAMVVHGGTIMSVLERYAFPHRDYYDWLCGNGCGWVSNWDGEKLTETEKL